MFAFDVVRNLMFIFDKVHKIWAPPCEHSEIWRSEPTEIHKCGPSPTVPTVLHCGVPKPMILCNIDLAIGPLGPTLLYVRNPCHHMSFNAAGIKQARLTSCSLKNKQKGKLAYTRHARNAEALQHTQTQKRPKPQDAHKRATRCVL